MDDNPYHHTPTAAPSPTVMPVPATPVRGITAMWATGVLLGAALLAAAPWLLRNGLTTMIVLGVAGNAVIYLGLAYGVYRRSRIAACALLGYSALHAFAVMAAFAPVPVYLLPLPALLLWVMLRGTVACFRHHQQHRSPQ